MKSKYNVLLYIQQAFNIKVIDYELNSTSTKYQIDFILDQQFLCRMKRVEDSISAHIKQSAVLKYSPCDWMINP